MGRPGTLKPVGPDESTRIVVPLGGAGHDPARRPGDAREDGVQVEGPGSGERTVDAPFRCPPWRRRPSRHAETLARSAGHGTTNATDAVARSFGEPAVARRNSAGSQRGPRVFRRSGNAARRRAGRGATVPARKHNVEEIVATLRQMEQLTGEGMSVSAAAKTLGITDQTYYRWRAC